MIQADLEKENGIDHRIKEWGVESKLSVVIIQCKRNWTFLIHESDKFCFITLLQVVLGLTNFNGRWVLLLF